MFELSTYLITCANRPEMTLRRASGCILGIEHAMTINRVGEWRLSPYCLSRQPMHTRITRASLQKRSCSRVRATQIKVSDYGIRADPKLTLSHHLSSSNALPAPMKFV